MGHAKYLSVITAVSRPEFLPIIAWSVPIDAEWILVTDGPQKIPRGLRPHLLIEGPKTGQWGDVQRRLGLEAATCPFVYFMDDDNLMLPILADLLVPYLEDGDHLGVLFGLVVNIANETHVWPAPLRVKRGRVDTAMFLGRKNAIMNLRFPEPSYGRGWPDLHGERHGDFVFMEAFENQFGLARLPAIYGFHNAIDLLKNSEPDLYSDLEAHKFTNDTLTTILNRCMINADVPQWWHKGAAIAPPDPPCRQFGECSPSCEASSP
jgi:hypothetical protein